jgi:1,4-dihydroxy-2-naphthoyl-CoA hydrolase
MELLMSIWARDITIEQINKQTQGCMISHVGIEVTEIGGDFLRGRMPVDERTRQPFGILHGGASVVLAETLASIGCQFTIDWDRYSAVGLEINANHIRGVSSGFVIGTSRAVHLGRRTQVWETHVKDEREKLVCISRITVAVVERVNN